MKRFVTLALIAGLTITLCAISYSASEVASSGTGNVTIELRDVTVVSAFESLFKGTKLSYIVKPDVSGTISSLKLMDVPFDYAMTTLAKSAGLEVTRDGDIYLIGKAEDKLIATAVSLSTKIEPIKSPGSKEDISSATEQLTSTLPLAEESVANPANEIIAGGMRNVYDQSSVYYPRWFQINPYPIGGYGIQPYQPQGQMSYMPYRPIVLPQPGSWYSIGLGPSSLIQLPSR